MRRDILNAKRRRKTKRSNMCVETGKVKHATVDAAEAAAIGLFLRPDQSAARRAAINVYRCPQCGSLHVGHGWRR